MGEGEDDQIAAELAAELARIKGARPHVVLGISAEAGPAEARAAFLALTKRRHPNRFARFPAGIQRVANEIFLLIREAHEVASGAVPAAAARGVSGPAVASGPPGRGASELRPPSARDLKPPGASELRPPTLPSVKPSLSPGTLPPGRIDDELRAAIAEKRRQRLVTPPAGVTPSAAARPPAAPTVATPATPAAPLTRDQKLRRGERLLDAGDLAGARALFRGLVAEKPDDRAAKAFLHFTAAREHLAGGRTAEARAELERAVAANPKLAGASQVLADLERNDKGRLSRWFRK